MLGTDGSELQTIRIIGTHETNGTFNVVPKIGKNFLSIGQPTQDANIPRNFNASKFTMLTRANDSRDKRIRKTIQNRSSYQPSLGLHEYQRMLLEARYFKNQKKIVKDDDVRGSSDEEDYVDD